MVHFLNFTHSYARGQIFDEAVLEVVTAYPQKERKSSPEKVTHTVSPWSIVFSHVVFRVPHDVFRLDFPIRELLFQGLGGEYLLVLLLIKQRCIHD